MVDKTFLKLEGIVIKVSKVSHNVYILLNMFKISIQEHIMVRFIGYHGTKLQNVKYNEKSF